MAETVAGTGFTPFQVPRPTPTPDPGPTRAADRSDVIGEPGPRRIDNRSDVIGDPVVEPTRGTHTRGRGARFDGR